MSGFLVNPGGTVQTGDIDNGAVTTAKIAAGAVTVDKVASGVIADHLARNMAASALAYTLAQNDATSITGSIGRFYLADNFESDSLAIKTNATFNAASNCYVNQGPVIATDITPTLASGCGGGFSVSVTGASNGGQGSPSYPLWRLFDKVGYGSGSYYSSYYDGIGTNYADRTINFTFDTAKKVGAITVGKEAANGLSYLPGNFTFEGSSDGGTTWDVLLTVTGGVAADHVGGTQKRYDLTSVGEYTHYRMDVTQTTGASRVNEIFMGTFEMFEVGSATNMTLAPTSTALVTANPTDLAAWIVINPQEVITVDTDITMTASIDGGTTDATGSWTKIGDVSNDGRELWRVDFDVSAQSGSSLTYEINTLNNKEIRVQDVVGIVALY